jgi:hypothetical protein
VRGVVGILPAEQFVPDDGRDKTAVMIDQGTECPGEDVSVRIVQPDT